MVWYGKVWYGMVFAPSLSHVMKEFILCSLGLARTRLDSLGKNEVNCLSSLFQAMKEFILCSLGLAWTHLDSLGENGTVRLRLRLRYAHFLFGLAWENFTMFKFGLVPFQ